VRIAQEAIKNIAINSPDRDKSIAAAQHEQTEKLAGMAWRAGL